MLVEKVQVEKKQVEKMQVEKMQVEKVPIERVHVERMPLLENIKPLKIKFSYLIISGFLLFLMAGCSELDSHDPANRFQQSDELYSAAMRWGEWLTLFQLMQANPNNPSSKVTPPTDEYLEYLSHLKVSHVETINSGIIENKKSAKSIYLIEYHPEDSSVIKKIRHIVNWWYDNKTNHWFTDTPLPKGFEMPEHRTIKLSP